VDCGGELTSKRQRCADCHGFANDQRVVATVTAEVIRRRTTESHRSGRGEVRGRIAQSQRTR
jgi:hypothetical protein